MNELLNDKQLSEILNISVKTLRNKVLNGDPLPPYISVPKTKTRLWRRDIVFEWISQFSNEPSKSKCSTNSLPKTHKEKRKKG